MSKLYDLIVFDWDGTLMDSEARIVACMQMAAEDCEIEVPSAEAARDIIGLGMMEAVTTLFQGIDVADAGRLVEAYRRHWLGDRLGASILFPGARELVGALSEAGSLLAVATGKSRRGLDMVLSETGLGTRFHATRCADEAHSKPHPQMLEELMVDLDTPPSRTLMIGDTEYDMQMAVNARVACVGVAHGVHAPERLIKTGAMQCFGDLQGLHRWLLETES